MRQVCSDGKTMDINKEINKENIKFKNGHWEDENVKTVSKIACVVPLKICKVMNTLTQRIKGNEFSIFCKSRYDEINRIIIVEDEYYIPYQEVSGASVDYKEDAPEGFNTVAHKHPGSMKSFSGTDDTYINQNFDYSLLWCKNEFVNGKIRIKTQYGLISLPLDVMMEEEEFEIEQRLLNKIKEKNEVILKNYMGGNIVYPPGMVNNCIKEESSKSPAQYAIEHEMEYGMFSW